MIGQALGKCPIDEGLLVLCCGVIAILAHLHFLYNASR